MCLREPLHPGHENESQRWLSGTQIGDVIQCPLRSFIVRRRSAVDPRVGAFGSEMKSHQYLFGYQEAETLKLGFQHEGAKYQLKSGRIPSMDWLLQNIPTDELIDTLIGSRADLLPENVTSTVKGLFDRQPVWAAGVMYKISEEARERESDNSTIYTRAYHAERPENFCKAIGYHTVSSGDDIGIRFDATWSVPETELTVVLNANLEVVGFTLGNDMSSRDIEGNNPLYLSQAKIYDDACSIGPRIWLKPAADTWPQTEIQLVIARKGKTIFKGITSTDRLHRTLSTLVDYLWRCNQFPFGVLLMTGTGIVPSDEFTLQADDEVRVLIPPIGELVNKVHVVKLTRD